MLKLRSLFLVVLFAILSTTDGHFLGTLRECLYSSEDLHDITFIDSYIFNKVTILQYNSTIGKFVGYTELGIKNAERLNNDPTVLQSERANLENFCKNGAKIRYPSIFDKTVMPQVTLELIKKAQGSSPARLMCSAYSFYPPTIQLTWLRDGKVVDGGVVSTEQMPNGDWYYQVHSQLDFMPKSGETIACVVEHPSAVKPMIFLWKPSASRADKIRIAVGLSGLVLGILVSVAGFYYYYKKKLEPGSKSEKSKIAVKASDLLLNATLSAAGFIKKKTSGRVLMAPFLQNHQSKA
ncbi:H-2 class II histocompatibility antigen, E-S beta chain-like [Trichomycterus rosablanca]|uniref:H-2 class II histocompatibility antigen, E-S beta chain-like n=1 Tax=Trichomycterus rosablanca TaxID=2290929 RepID=UPI002F356EB9